MKNCKICGSALDLSQCQVFSSKCFLNHVPLKRYKCPTCGVIFGTIEMINGTVDTIKKAYLFCDTVYKEENSVVNETRTFMSLAPKKEGLYLNFGCGNTSTTVADLRKQNWNILGYEPFLPNPLPNIIKDKSLLCNYKFDGIMSNNLLEHLQDPVVDLVFLKGLLKDKGSLMAHSTPC
ncbi:MAG: methyltransferase domain-containing protein, partial [Bacteroidales bacterium]